MNFLFLLFTDTKMSRKIEAFSAPAALESQGLRMKMDTSFPIPPSAEGLGCKTISHPYFTLIIPGMDDEASVKLEWQIHPAKNGPLYYTLVQKDKNLGSRVCAIYHHARWEQSLSLRYSEGVLLLSESQDREFEGIVVASLLGILVQLRMLNTCKKQTRNSAQLSVKRFSVFFCKYFGTIAKNLK